MNRYDFCDEFGVIEDYVWLNQVRRVEIGGCSLLRKKTWWSYLRPQETLPMKSNHYPGEGEKEA